MTFSRQFTSFLSFALVAAGLVLLCQPENGCAQDLDADGIPDAREAALGGNPQRKDIFVECDYMQLDLNQDRDGADRGEHSHRLSEAAVRQLIQIFADAPVSNPGGVCRGGSKNGAACTTKTDCANSPCSFTGITLHLEQNQALADQRFLDFTNRKGGRNFFDIKGKNFDFANRAPYYHYCILAHDASEEMGSASGQAEIFGNDFMVTLGAWPSETGLPTLRKNGLPVGTVKDQVGTFLHELGHNLGLDHGGGAPLSPAERVKNFKPNYLSVMNYAFQTMGINGQFDFSRTQLSILDEQNLNEAIGIGGSSTRYFCQQGAQFKWDSGNAINWNCTNIVPVKENINGDRTFLAEQLRDKLQGFNDWANVRLNFTTSPVYDAKAGSGFTQHQRYLGAYRLVDTASRGVDREPEATWPQGRCLEFLSINREPNSQGVVFRTMVRPQSDENKDGIGDVCGQ